MKPSEIDIDNIQVASPCPASWRKMKGDGTVRHCDECKLNVYNLSNFSRAEIQNLIANNESGRLCIRLHRRADGTLITRDCPVGVRSLQRRKLAWVSAACFGFLTMIGVASNVKSEEDRIGGRPFADAIENARRIPVLEPIVNKLWPQPPVLMGAMPTPPIVTGKLRVGP